jgi:3-dehydroquinate synthase
MLAARTSAALGWIGDQDCERLEALLKRAGLPVTAGDAVDPDLVLEHMQIDKKADQAGLKLILLEDIGSAVVTRAPERALLRSVLGARLGSP